MGVLFFSHGTVSEEVTDRNRLFDAVFRLLEKLAADGSPVCVLLDDLHWCDESSAALTHYIARAATGVDVQVACAARSAGLEDNDAARRLIHTFRREERLRRIDLAPLTISDTVELVRRVDRHLDAERIFTESDGNPLFALEVARAFQQGKDPISDTLEGLILERFSVCGKRAREIIPWAATLGRACTVDFLSRLTKTAPYELLDAVEELERHDLLQITASGGYDFTHDLVRLAAYRNISGARRRLNHLTIARTLAGTGDLEGAVAGEVAHHASLGGERELAARSFAAAGRHSLRVCAFDETAAFSGRGLEHLDGSEPLVRIQLHLELLALYVHPDMARFCPPDFQERLRRVTGEAKAIGDRALVSHGFRLVGWLHYHRGDFGGALKATRNAQEACREADPVTIVQTIAENAHCLCLLERDMERAEKLAREAQSLADEFDVKIESFELSLALGMLRQHAGALDEAHRLIEEAFQCSWHNRFPWAQSHCLSRLIMVELERERPGDALAWCLDLKLMTARLDEGSEAPFAAALEALSRLALGDGQAELDLGEAVECLRQVDSKWMLAYVQNAAAAHDLVTGRPEEASRRAEDALFAAEAVQPRSEIALARATLARVALQANRPKDAADFRKFARAELEKPRRLSARALRAVREVARELAG